MDAVAILRLPIDAAAIELETRPALVETLTESFCERCGTRYEFKAPTRLNPLRKTRGFIGGLKNYLTSQDDLSDAMGDAMRTEEDQLASAQLEAFHESFNFCISCRQYTCLNCWNDGEGRCRSCAPVPGTDDLAERLAASLAEASAVAVVEPPAAEPAFGLEAWPTSDVPEPAPYAGGRADVEWPADDLAGTPAPAELEPATAEVEWTEPVVAEPELETVAAESAWTDLPVAAVEEQEPVAAEGEPEPVATEIEPEPVVAEGEPEPTPAWGAPVEPEWAEPVVAETEAEPELEAEPERFAEVEKPAPPRSLRAVAWDEDAELELEAEPEPVAAEIAEPELEPVAAEVEPEPVVAEVEVEPEPVVAAIEAEPEPAPVVAEIEPEPEPEPVVAEVEVEPEPVVAEAEPAPEPAGPEVEPEPVAAAAEIEPEPEPVPRPAPRRIGPISETILRFPPRDAPAPRAPEQIAAEADSPELAARRAQLDMLGLGDPGEGPVAGDRPSVLPYRSRGATPTAAEIAARTGGAGFWEASAREVAGATANIGVQNCGQCGLSLSASARFCRRCGTAQARSA